jgi:hypothetical protein
VNIFLGKDSSVDSNSNIAKGRNSYDANVGNTLVTFFNKNISPYPTEVGGPKFDLVPVTKQKDVMLNVSRMYAQQEYDRIMELVSVLHKQAEQIKRRLEITDAIHAAKYEFQVVHGKIYWLVFDTRIKGTRLCHTGPNGWNTGIPDDYEYLCAVKQLGDHTWIEIQNE